jgi:hypothetical protein
MIEPNFLAGELVAYARNPFCFGASHFISPQRVCWKLSVLELKLGVTDEPPRPVGIPTPAEASSFAPGTIRFLMKPKAMQLL